MYDLFEMPRLYQHRRGLPDYMNGPPPIYLNGSKHPTDNNIAHTTTQSRDTNSAKIIATPINQHAIIRSKKCAIIFIVINASVKTEKMAKSQLCCVCPPN